MAAKKPQKNNVVLETLSVIYLDTDTIRPNDYNPNRQSAHDFELLCKSIREDGMTQPIIVHKESMEVVDGEHRWRACRALGYEQVPVVLVSMTAEQRRIATLRHNRARGSEDAALAADVLKGLADMGAIDWAADSLQLDPIDVKRLLEDCGSPELPQLSPEDVPLGLLGPSGKGLSASDKSTPTLDLSSDYLRARQKLADTERKQQEREMREQDLKTYKLVLFYTGEEAKIIRQVLVSKAATAETILTLCRKYR